MTLGCDGHGVSTTARGLDGEQRVVDRPQARTRCDHDRPAEVDREVADRVAEGERDQQAAHSLGDHDFGAQASRGRHQRRRVERRAGQLGREVR